MKEVFKIIAGLFFTAIILFSCQGDLLYKDGKYSIRKKNIVSYYQASPDLFVKTDKGEVKINLNGFGKRLIITYNIFFSDTVFAFFIKQIALATA